MALTLADFRTISNGSHNVGQITLNENGDGLQKINNHVWQTSKNNVQTDAQDNRAVRQALYDAFSRAGNLSQQMLNDIRTILLGGTNGSRSLSRDFVKQLIKTVDDTRDQNADLIGKMNFVSKSLSERTVSVVKNDLVTSSKGAAYEIYASEQMDNYADDGLAGLKSIREYFASGAPNRNHFILGLSKVASSLNHMISIDERLAGRDRNGSSNFKSIYDRLADRANNLIVNGHQGEVDLFIQSLKPEFEQVYNEMGLGDVAADHLARIFPPDEPVPENIGENQNEQMEQIDENQVNQLNVQGDNDIQPVVDDFDKKLSASLKEWFAKIASVKNNDQFVDLTALKGTPRHLFDEIQWWISGSTIIKNLSILAQAEIVMAFDEMKSRLPDGGASWYSCPPETVNGILLEKFFGDLGNDNSEFSSALTNDDKNKLAETLNCSCDDVAKKLGEYFRAELGKLGASLGAVKAE